MRLNATTRVLLIRVSSLLRPLESRKGNAVVDDNYTPPVKAVNHANYLANKIAQRSEAKYLKGDVEHRGDLSRKNTLPMALEEALDLPIYLITLEDNIELTKSELAYAEHHLGQILKDTKDCQSEYVLSTVQRSLNAVTRALNILHIGNPEGVPEEER